MVHISLPLFDVLLFACRIQLMRTDFSFLDSVVLLLVLSTLLF